MDFYTASTMTAYRQAEIARDAELVRAGRAARAARRAQRNTAGAGTTEVDGVRFARFGRHNGRPAPVVEPPVRRAA